ncbi:UDP-N-acetyl-D-mannosamine dehydrogenase [Caballeronia zhejiangensis]|uniref:UDP-N-acetyl-D-mannosamine dehydrogenase n=1 Tax=Caballeronia zhejiangensis TaxID=871203 RepID=UPI001F51FDC7|nr:UDP-N-acetyl-D-mannosamine dehydrogenase [Caballeronia zhejiangensis]MCI1047003.1 UDP-N-acetyl-D-mannosamine dehydrogenase [Caballeronia zhejiangensis]
MAFDTISIIGLGYIGLPTAAAFAGRKKRVIGVDVSQHVVDTINRGEIHIVEPELDLLVKAAVTQGMLRATREPEAADAFLIAVPTPFTEGNRPDLSYVESASRAIAPLLKKGDLVVLESTSPVGATEKVAQWMAEARPDLTFPQQSGDNSDIRVAHCPERVLPGKVVHELVENDRVIGGLTRRCAEAARELYQIFVQGECVLTDARTAEMCKLTENSFRDVNIAFANELSVIAEKLDINVWELVRLANRHPRVKILQPGPGVGGHCIAVDPWFIVDSAPEEARLIRTARIVNDDKPRYVVDRVRRVASRFKEPVIACLGLAFKADIDDLRESPSIDIVEELASLNMGRLLVVEPNIDTLPTKLAEHVELCGTSEALTRADVVVLLVDHREFRSVDLRKLQEKAVVDTRGVFHAPR